MVPTQFMLGAVAMLADSSSEFPYLRDEFVSPELFEVFVHTLHPPESNGLDERSMESCLRGPSLSRVPAARHTDGVGPVHE
jgi:hypothetical protein